VPAVTPEGDPLDHYRRRRHPAVTPEPVPSTTKTRGPTRAPERPLFVIQEHHARSLHWDFRLEHDGVLVSWAVPKGLPLDTKTNHLAVHTEDHPLEYATFRGEIPEGEYGAGEVILWDTGPYDELKWSDREVMVDLHGHRVQGRYVLFATNRSGGKASGAYGQDWMVHRMDPAPTGYQPPPADLRPMLATPGSLPADDKGWSYEFKWDGIRAITTVDGGRLHIASRNGNDVSPSFPELRPLGERSGSHQLVLDGEIVAFDDDKRPSFQRLQPRIHTSDANKARRLAAQDPAVYVLFDLLYQDGELLTALPYSERRARLERLGLGGDRSSAWTLSPRFDGPGSDVLHASQEQGLEGVVAKRNDAPYLPGRRSLSWIKAKNLRTQEVVIGGWTPGEGQRRGKLGSLLLGIPDTGGLAYVGQVGTGFSEATLEDLGRALGDRSSPTNPFTTEVPSRYRRVAHWVEPTLVGVVRFSEWTTDGRMRQPSWRGLRPDKKSDEVRRES
jgi:bifunctional non-homologous end joining protein LigD